MIKNFPYQGIILGFISFICFSTVNASNKYISFHSLANLNGWFLYKNVISLLIVLIVGYIIWRKDFFYLKNQKAVWARAIILAINQCCVMFAVKYLPLDLFYSITFLMPLVITMFGIVFLKESATYKNFIALAFGLIGAIIIIQPTINNPSFIGVILTLIVVITGALSALIVKLYMSDSNALSSSISIYILSILLSIGLSYDSFEMIYDIKLIAFSVIVSIVAILATVFFMQAYQKSQARTIAPIQYTQIIWGIIFGYVLFNQIPTSITLIGCSIIIVGNYINLSKISK
jgi:drug/metabolite transporter (DMT)-like permease